jgi:hypothetical protein
MLAKPTLLVATGDLLHDCPTWEFLYQPWPRGLSMDSLCSRRIHALREAWSHKIVQVAAPSGPDVLCQHYYDHDIMTYDLWFFHYRCRSRYYWKVIGPDALLADLEPIGHHCPPRSLACCPANPGAERLNLYLCQHEIGD